MASPMKPAQMENRCGTDRVASRGYRLHRWNSESVDSIDSPKKPVEKIGSTVLLGLLAVLCGALAIAPDAVLKMLGFGN